MLKKLFLLSFLIILGSLYSPAAAMPAKTDIYIAIDKSAQYYDRVVVKTVTLGRTNRETISASSRNAGSFYNNFVFMNHVYEGEMFVNAMWYARGVEEPIHNVSLVISENTLRQNTKSGGINLMFYPNEIEIQ